MNVIDIFEQLKRLGGLFQHLGIDFAQDADGLSTRMAISPQLQGSPGVAHGGSVMALMDTALGLEAQHRALARGCAVSTVEMKVNFLRPARLGKTLVTRTEVQSEGKSLLVISGSAVEDGSDAPVAFAVGTFNMYKPRGLRMPGDESPTEGTETFYPEPPGNASG